MKAGFQTAIRQLYPPRCLACGDLVDSDFGLCGPCWRDTPFVAGTVCEACGTPVIGGTDGFRIECDACMARARPWAMGRAALLYEGQARKLVLSLKHGDRTDIARPAGKWMVLAGREVLKEGRVIVPVPLHWTRFMRRKYNQSALLAQVIADEAGLLHVPDLLVRRRRTKSLDHDGIEARFAAMQGAISVNPKHIERMHGREIVLIDDVMTSGATLTACADACISGGAREVCVLVLCRKT
ncbi:MAG: ComF family protein [Rhodobacteraceae bacterium]|nr:ComF family protein [Paracoccaceae bacterium]